MQLRNMMLAAIFAAFMMLFGMANADANAVFHIRCFGKWAKV